MADAATASGETMKRFNSPEHLSTWQERGRYPAIHDGIADAAASLMRGKCLLDLGCSYGLLGARIAKESGQGMPLGIDADGKVIAAARDAKVSMFFTHLRVTAETLPLVAELVRDHSIDVIIARRILPELFGQEVMVGGMFAAMMAKAGVKEMFVEGRVVSERSTNALASIDAEVAMLSGSYREARRIKAVSYLVRQEPV
jgi:hypothetical protein